MRKSNAVDETDVTPEDEDEDGTSALPDDLPEAERKRLMRLRKELRGEELGELEELDAVALRAAIVTASRNLLEVQQARGADQALATAKARAAELDGPYKDGSKHQKARVDYALFLLDRAG